MLELTISGFLAFLGSGLFVLGYISNNSLFPESLSATEEKMYVKKCRLEMKKPKIFNRT